MQRTELETCLNQYLDVSRFRDYCPNGPQVEGRGEDQRVTGTRRSRLALLLNHDLNLFAFHLPLYAHPEVGNNVQFAQKIGLPLAARFGLKHEFIDLPNPV